MWSLSVEEQYYLIFPLLLKFTNRRWWMPLILLASAASFVLCFYHVGIFSPAQTFYMPFTRAWQFGLGGMVALARKPASTRINLEIFAWPALALLLTLLYFQIENLNAIRDFRPGPSSLLACLATATLIASANARIERGTVTAWLRPIGDMSYALYLVHWPILSLYRNATMSSVTTWQVEAALAAFIAVAAFILHTLIEQPLRRRWSFSSRQVALIACATCAIALCLSGAAEILGRNSANEPLSREKSYATFGAKCKSTPPYDLGAACRNSDRPEIVIWGDSMALATASGVSAMPGVRVGIATRPLCGPFLTEAPVRAGIFDKAWALECIRFNHSVIEKLRTMPSVRAVALVSAYNQYLDREAMVVRTDGSRVPADALRAIKDLANTVVALRALGKRVVLLSRVPAADFDVGMCVERLAAGRLILRRHGCNIPFRDERGSNVRAVHFVTEVGQRANVDVIRVDKPLCDRGWCRPVRDGVSLYHDGGHLSTRGSKWLANRLDLFAEMNRRAR